jgi:hypothetical protein
VDEVDELLALEALLALVLDVLPALEVLLVDELEALLLDVPEVLLDEPPVLEVLAALDALVLEAPPVPTALPVLDAVLSVADELPPGPLVPSLGSYASQLRLQAPSQSAATTAANAPCLRRPAVLMGSAGTISRPPRAQRYRVGSMIGVVATAMPGVAIHCQSSTSTVVSRLPSLES